MRSLLAILLYAAAKAIWPGLGPRTPGNVSEYDPTVRRFIRLLNTVPQQRGPECKAIDLDDTQEMPRFDSRWQDATDPLKLREGTDWRLLE